MLIIVILLHYSNLQAMMCSDGRVMSLNKVLYTEIDHLMLLALHKTMKGLEPFRLFKTECAIISSVMKMRFVI